MADTARPHVALTRSLLPRADRDDGWLGSIPWDINAAGAERDPSDFAGDAIGSANAAPDSRCRLRIPAMASAELNAMAGADGRRRRLERNHATGRCNLPGAPANHGHRASPAPRALATMGEDGGHRTARRRPLPRAATRLQQGHHRALDAAPLDLLRRAKRSLRFDLLRPLRPGAANGVGRAGNRNIPGR